MVVRKRAIVKAMKHSACNLMDRYFRAEHAFAVSGTRIISQEIESALCTTLEHYGELIDKHNILDDDRFGKDREWLLEVSMFL